MPTNSNYGSITANGTASNAATPNWSINYAPTYGTASGTTMMGMASTQSDSAELPAIVLDSFDEHGKKVFMTLTPESGMSPSDCTKLMMLCIAMSVSPEKFSALNYVKKNNLERHFKYS